MAGSDLFTGSLELLILHSLSFGPRHGYAVGKWIRDTTEEAILVQEGALYPALHRMERRDLVSEEWGVTDTNREAKFYRLTAAGQSHVEAEVTRWERHAGAVNAALAVPGN
jgi:transcriptional regulator